MWPLILITIVTIVRARVIENCSGVVIHNINHEKEVLKSGLDSPYQLAIDYDTNYLFFSYSSAADHNDGFKSAYLNLKTGEFDIIRGIHGGFANAVDSKNHKVYLGGNDGIYEFDFTSKRAKIIGAKDQSIWQLYFNEKLYYTNYPNEKAYTFENGVSNQVPELVGTNAMLLVFDKNDNLFFSNSSGLWCHKKNKSNAVFVGEYNINGFTTDLNKNIFFSTPTGIYAIDENSQDVKELTNTENVYGIAIESDNNIIYADEDNIIRLKPTKERCFYAEKNKS